jgi:hypothetical protein
MHNQLTDLLTKYDSLFVHWSHIYPSGLSIGPHMYSDDIANEARIAYAKNFTPHCELGHENCTSVLNGTELVNVTRDGENVCREVVLYDEHNDIMRHEDGTAKTALKPVIRVRRIFSPSCEKASLDALQSAKYRAMDVARKFTSNGIKETSFSSVQCRDGGLVEWLEKNGINAVGYANEIGIFSPWVDTTLNKLDFETGHGAMAEFLKESGANQFDDCRLDVAFKIAARRGVLPALLQNSFGYSFKEIALNNGVSEKSLLMKMSRYRKEVGATC